MNNKDKESFFEYIKVHILSGINKDGEKAPLSETQVKEELIDSLKHQFVPMYHSLANDQKALLTLRLSLLSKYHCQKESLIHLTKQPYDKGNALHEQMLLDVSCSHSYIALLYSYGIPSSLKRSYPAGKLTNGKKSGSRAMIPAPISGAADTSDCYS